MTFPPSRSLLLAALILLILAGCNAAIGSFGPALPTPLAGHFVKGVPQRISFSELNSAPSSYVGQYLRVTGRLKKMSPTVCPGHKGPAPRWSLIAESLQLDAVGYDRIIPNLPDDTLITVDGYWRLYNGPLGCGKAPARGVVWYLETIHVVEPNPLPLFAGPADLMSLGVATPTSESGAAPSATPPTSVGSTPIGATASPLPTFTPTSIVPGLPSATPTILPSPTASPTPRNTPRGTAVVTPSATPPPGASATPTPPPTETKAVTPAPTDPPTTPLPTIPPTNTPGGYPLPTNTPDGYP